VDWSDSKTFLLAAVADGIMDDVQGAFAAPHIVFCALPRSNMGLP